MLRHNRLRKLLLELNLIKPSCLLPHELLHLLVLQVGSHHVRLSKLHTVSHGWIRHKLWHHLHVRVNACCHEVLLKHLLINARLTPTLLHQLVHEIRLVHLHLDAVEVLHQHTVCIHIVNHLLITACSLCLLTITLSELLIWLVWTTLGCLVDQLLIESLLLGEHGWRSVRTDVFQLSFVLVLLELVLVFLVRRGLISQVYLRTLCLQLGLLLRLHLLVGLLGWDLRLWDQELLLRLLAGLLIHELLSWLVIMELRPLSALIEVSLLISHLVPLILDVFRDLGSTHAWMLRLQTLLRDHRERRKSGLAPWPGALNQGLALLDETLHLILGQGRNVVD